MKRLIVLAAGLLLVAALLPTAAFGAPGQTTRSGIPGPAAAPIAAPPSALEGPRFVPLPRALAGNATVLVHVYGYDSGPEAGATVSWWVTTDTEQASGFGTVDSTGLATLSGLPAATNNGEIVISPTSGEAYYDIWNLSWPDPAGTDMGVQPGKITLQLDAGGAWSDYGWAWVEVYSRNGDAYQLAGSRVDQTGAVTSGTPLALNSDVTGAAVYFWVNEGAEVPSLAGAAVSPGSTTTTGAVVDQAASQRIANFTWASGKPGTVARLSFQNFPAGWVNWMYGQSEASGVQPVKVYSDWTSPGGTSWVSRSFTIPTTAKPGFTYDIYAEHSTGPLVLSEPYQVCTFIPSRTTVRPTGSVRFSGRVPFDSGHTKKLIVYRRTTKAGQPPRAGGFTFANGWRKVGTATANGYGKYTTPYMKPGRTSWYVLWYPKDGAGHWGAWTSVAKVTVR